MCNEKCSNQDTTLIAETVPHSGIDIGIENLKKLYDHGDQYERLWTQSFNMKRLFRNPSTFSLKTYEPKKVSRDMKKILRKLDGYGKSWIEKMAKFGTQKAP